MGKIGDIVTNRTNRIIFDNAGQVTLQLLGWAHTFSEASDASDVVFDFITDPDISGWDGHDPDAAGINPSAEEIKNGCYIVIEICDNEPMMHYDTLCDELAGSSWHNASAFANALSSLVCQENYGELAEMLADDEIGWENIADDRRSIDSHQRLNGAYEVRVTNTGFVGVEESGTSLSDSVIYRFRYDDIKDETPYSCDGTHIIQAMRRLIAENRHITVAIRNVNEKYGDPIEFTGASIRQCELKLAKHLLSIGYAEGDPEDVACGFVEGEDYEIVDDDE